MKTYKLNNLLLAAGALFFGGLLTTSCEDYLTVEPTDQITEEQFWQDKNDLDNVRAGAYKNLTESYYSSTAPEVGVTHKILIWGELRTDNLILNVMNKEDYTGLQNAVLKPTYSMFDYSEFYTGINYCNLVLQRGKTMAESGIDPSFGEGDWLPIKAEIQALRALYYFYLVKAYRDVPYRSEPVTTDKEGRNAYDPAVAGVAILGDLIDSLEVAKTYAASNYGSAAENCGRFTKRSIRTLLADMYLWRGCLLKDYFSKTIREGVDSIVNVTDVVAEDGTITTADGTVVDNAYCNAQSTLCFEKAIENADWTLDDMTAEYKRELARINSTDDVLLNQKYPLTRFGRNASVGSVYDPVYSAIFATGNSDESIFEIQFDGTNNKNNAIPYILTSASSTVLTPQIYTVNPVLANVNSVAPTRGFGKADVRMHETFRYTQSGTAVYPFVKGLATSVSIQDLEDMSEGASYGGYNTQLGFNWPVYRLTDLMLIKAECIARLQGSAKNNDDLYEGFDLVNSIFARCNPAAQPSTETSSDLATTRLTGISGTTIDHTLTDYYGKDKTGDDLLTLVYQERRREFVGEGKFWFDLVRQAEYSNDCTTSLTDYITLQTAVKNRLRYIYSLYNPYLNEEMKVSGVENGGKLVQNPIWARYSNN